MIIDRFHCLYNSTYLIRSNFLIKIKVPAILRLIILQTANLLIPLVLNSQKKDINFSLENAKKNRTDFIVSLTSFPKRIGKVHLVIESMLRQSFLPSRIILWLSIEQFPSIDMLPQKLLDLRKRGLEIVLTEGDLRSYKKYFFLLKQQPEAGFIIIDDDVFYQSLILENLINTHIKYPKAVCANRCAIINPCEQYSNWSGLKGNNIEERDDLLPTGCGGVLYPPYSLHDAVLDDSLFTSICADADDIWLNVCAFLKGTSFVYTGKNEYLLAVTSNQNEHLHSKNVGESNNDKRIKNVRTYFKEKHGVDVINRDVV
ncbi:hypothetical protein [Pseudocolwellia agarivorans]|uniref:hypothetical protein n=1 Tax=Pseudocolwellia agarivorans TaxID=1911682 RepID=UPI003F8826AF